MKKKCYIGFDICFDIKKDQYPMKSYDTHNLYVHTIAIIEIGNTIREAPVYHKGYFVWSVFGVWTETYFKDVYQFHYEIQKSDYERLLKFAPNKLFFLKKEDANNLFMKYLYNIFEDMPELLI